VTSTGVEAEGVLVAGVLVAGVLAPDGVLAPLGDDADDGLEAGVEGVEFAGLDADVGLDAVEGLDADVGLDDPVDGLDAGVAPPVVEGVSEFEPPPPLQPATSAARANAITPTVECPFIC
jgi:hypothetical protein